MEIVALLIALISAAAAVTAAVIAWKSLSASKRLADENKQAEHDLLKSQVYETATELMHAAVGTTTLANDTQAALTSAFASAGGINSGLLKLHTEELKKHHSALGEHERHARSICNNPEALADRSVADLRADLAILNGMKIAVERLHGKFERDFENYTASYRNKT